MKTGRRYIKVTDRRIHYYKISEVAEMLGITQRTIRYYEQISLLPSARRTKGRMRLFNDGEVKLIQKIKEFQQDFKMSLDVIRKKIEPDLASFVQKREKTRVKIVVDSTSSIPPELAEQYGIEVIPMKVVYGKSIFDDGENINNRELAKLLEVGRHNPKTQPPDYGEIIALYNNLYERGAEKIISIHLSSGISDTFFAASKAATYMSHFIDIEVIDSQCIALGSGLLAIEAAKLLADDISFSEVVKAIKKLAKGAKEVLFVDSLKYLTRGKDVHEYLELLLDFKPVFTTVNGKVKLLARAEDKAKAIEILKSVLSKDSKAVGVMFGGNKADADRLFDELQAILGSDFPLIKSEISTIPSVYFGPKSLGIAVY